jgi:hypothetical protein
LPSRLLSYAAGAGQVSEASTTDAGNDSHAAGSARAQRGGEGEQHDRGGDRQLQQGEQEKPAGEPG